MRCVGNHRQQAASGVLQLTEFSNCLWQVYLLHLIYVWTLINRKSVQTNNEGDGLPQTAWFQNLKFESDMRLHAQPRYICNGHSQIRMYLKYK